MAQKAILKKIHSMVPVYDEFGELRKSDEMEEGKELRSKEQEV
jgi:hypothetical protein